MDPIWLAMVLGAQTSLRPTAYVTMQNSSIAPEIAYFQLKRSIRGKSNIDVDILDTGPGSPERRQILAEGLKKSNLLADAEIRQRARLMLESVLRNSPRSIIAARFSENDVRQALITLAAKVALLVNRFGTAATQTLTAIPFEEFKQVTQDVNRIQIAHR